MPHPPQSKNSREAFVVLIIFIVAVFFRFYDFSSYMFWSAIVGVVSVLGIYLLCKQLFGNWHMAAMTSYLTAISFWHVTLSRLDDCRILALLLMLLSVYFFWKGKTTTHFVDCALAGILLGVSIYYYPNAWLMVFVILVVMLGHLYVLKKDFSHEKYIRLRDRTIKGFALLMVTGIIVCLPLIWKIVMHTDQFVSSIHNYYFKFPFISGSLTQLIWPIGILFIIGFLRSIVKLLITRRHHGHFSTLQLLFVCWFVVGLISMFIVNYFKLDGLELILILSPVLIFAGEGLWWIHEYIRKYHIVPENLFVANLVIIILLFAITLFNFNNLNKSYEPLRAFVSSYDSR